MLTKKSVLSQFNVEYSGNNQTISYLESVDIFEDGIFLGSISNKRSFLNVFGADLGMSLEEINGEPIAFWDLEETYGEGSFVTHNNEYWFALQESTNEEPTEVSLFWKLIPRPTQTEVMVQGLKEVTALYLSEDVQDEETSEEALTEIATVYPSWQAWKPVKAEKTYTYNGKFYRARTSHLTQPDWTPDVAISLWGEVRPTGVVSAWVQPLGSHDAYPLGFVVTHSGSTWTSLVDNNVWEPGVGAQWEEVVEGGGEEPPAGPEAWVQPVGAQDAYQIDDTVTHNGQTWISINADNVWEPGVFGWTVV